MFSTTNVRSWATKCGLHKPESAFSFNLVSGRNDNELHAFAKFCHQLITDRDLEFTLEKRKKLYRGWSRAAPRSLMAVHNGSGQIVASSIVLPLTQEAYRSFWYKADLDALDIGAAELLGASAADAAKFLLVDILAKDKTGLSGMPPRQANRSIGLGLRALIYHLSLYYDARQSISPVLLCSTLSPKLISKLALIGFDERPRQGKTDALIFRLDTGQTKGLSLDQVWMLDGARAVIKEYVGSHRVAHAPAGVAARP